MTKHALIVDDSKTACRMLAVLLQKHGIDSTSVYSAEAALEELRHRKPDVIFMDQSMPGMDGLETVKIIKSNPDTATIPVMMYTAKEGDVYLGQARALGALDVLPKGQLKEKLDQALEKLHINEQEGETDDTSPNDAAAIADHRPAPSVADHRSPPNPARDRDANLRRQLQTLRSELSRQLYMVLTEDQITQKEYARWLLEGMDRRVAEHLSELEATLQARQAARESELQRLARRRQRLLLGAVGVVAALCLVVLWQIAGLGRDGAALRAELAQLSGQLGALETALTQATASTTTSEGSGRNRLGIVSDAGEPLGVLLGLDDGGRFFAALSPTDYIFHINPMGRVGVPLQRKYFAVPNCNGQPLTQGQGGVLYRDAVGQLWYTPKQAPVLDIRPASMMDGEERCEAVDAGELALRPLRPNDPQVTGIGLDAEPVALVQRRASGR